MLLWHPSFVVTCTTHSHRRWLISIGHVIKLGIGNDDACLAALKAYPNELQVGGGINLEHASYWIDKGASKVIVTSYLFPEAVFDLERLRKLTERIGAKSLVVDLSCRAANEGWVVAIDKWQRRTEFQVNEGEIISRNNEAFFLRNT